MVKVKINKSFKKTSMPRIGVGNPWRLSPKQKANIEELHCGGLGLTRLPNGMVNLKELYCSHNRLTNLPYDMNKLEVLYCDNNSSPWMNDLDLNIQLYHNTRKEMQNISAFIAHNKYKSNGKNQILNNDLIKELKKMLY